MNEKRNLQPVRVLAKLFGVSERQVQQLAKEGSIPYVEARPYKFDLLPAIQAYIRYLSDRVEAEARPAEFEAAEYEKLRAVANLRMTQDKRIRYERRQLAANMHNGFTVNEATADLQRAIIEELEALPDKAAAEWRPGLSAMEAAELIRAEAFATLNRLGDYEFIPAQAEKRRLKFEAREKEKRAEEATK